MKIADGPFAGLERNGYRAILVDPPWFFRSRTALQSRNWDSARDVEKHYACMSIEEIAALPVQDLITENAHLFLWITAPMLVEGKHLPIMKAWGFKPSSIMFTWAKLKRSYRVDQLRFTPTAASDFHVGLGLTSRKNAEFCLLGRRPKSKRIGKDVRELIVAPVREHSRKPDEVYERIERYCAGPYLELFARQSWPNWTSWGLEKAKFDPSVDSVERSGKRLAKGAREVTVDTDSAAAALAGAGADDSPHRPEIPKEVFGRRMMQ